METDIAWYQILTDIRLIAEYELVDFNFTSVLN